MIHNEIGSRSVKYYQAVGYKNGVRSSVSWWWHQIKRTKTVDVSAEAKHPARVEPHIRSSLGRTHRIQVQIISRHCILACLIALLRVQKMTFTSLTKLKKNEKPFFFYCCILFKNCFLNTMGKPVARQKNPTTPCNALQGYIFVVCVCMIIFFFEKTREL